VADTYVIHEGQTGAVSNYAVPFDYLSKTFVKATVNGTPVSFTFLSTYLIEILPNPIGTVKIYRDTPDEAITTFTDGSVLLDDDLNSAFVQSIHISQEAKDTATDEMDAKIEIAEGLLEETEDARDETVSNAAAAAASAATAIANKDLTIPAAATAVASKDLAVTKAAEAAASAAQAQALVDSISDGPVTSVNGKTGIVSGLAEQSNTYTKTETDNKITDTSYTKAQVDAIIAEVAGNVGIVSAYKYADFF